MKIINISGKAQHGKDTVGQIIKNVLVKDGNRVLVTHFADLLKYICKSYFDWDGQKDERGRGLLQYVGTDVIRKKNENFWVDFVADILTYFEKDWDWVIIPDTRFPNEVDRLRERGLDTTHIRVIRQNFDNHLTEEQLKHPSETALDDVVPDYTIFNSGELALLEDMVEKLVKENLYD